MMTDTDAPLPTAALRDVAPYATPETSPSIELRLDGNEGSWPTAELWSTLAEESPHLLHSYPRQVDLEAAIARAWGVDSRNVLVTAGADEALDRLCRAFLEPSRSMVLPEPTFVMLRHYAGLAGAEVRSVAWESNEFPTDAVATAADDTTTLIPVVSPNNPTGAVATAAQLAFLAEAAPRALIVLDAAYGEFADDDLTPTALRIPNAVVVRTFSKAWGLAGCRVGYVIGAPEVIDVLRAAGGPYAVAGPSIALAMHRLERDGSAVREFVDRVRVERQSLFERLARANLRAQQSQANFVFVRTERAPLLRSELSNRGIAVRTFPDDPRLGDAVRITCPGNADDFARLQTALDEVLSESRA